MVAGNVEARDEVVAVLGDVPHVLADNVVPRIGVLAPDSARSAIREMFLSHVIGGKRLSSRADFTAMVRGATPDVVLTGVELLARGLDEAHPGAGDVVVVDVGGATTDAAQRGKLDPEEAALSREVVATTPVTRTVEGDLGMRWSAVSTVEAAGLDLAEAAQRRHDDPGMLPGSEEEVAVDEAIAAAAVGLAPAAARRPLPGRGRPRRPGGRAQRQGPPRGRPAGRVRGRAPQRPAGSRGPGARRQHRRGRGGLACPAARGWSSTTTTSSPPPGCWPGRTPTRRTGW